MRLAQYSADNIGHYGLALEHYCHFTSPIRRYTDLIIQRLLTNELPQGFDLVVTATACSAKERLSFKAESSVVTLKKLRLAHRYFQEDPTRIYRAIITRIKPFALFFEVPDLDLEGSLHISEIGNDYYEFNPRTLSMRGSRTGKTYTSGQEIEVRIDKLDFILQENKWSLILPPRHKKA
jgi:ribonuclease R